MAGPPSPGSRRASAWPTSPSWPRRPTPAPAAGSPSSFALLDDQLLDGYQASASFQDTLVLEANEVLSFEYGNGGDGYYYDSVAVDLTIDPVPCTP